MKKILMFIICFLTIGDLTAQELNASDLPVDFQYFNEKNQSISKAVFEKKRSSNKFLDIPGDSANHRRLTARAESGQISYVQSRFNLLENARGEELDESKPLVNIYYPDKDSVVQVVLQLPHHYSFTVMANDGKYISYFGEFSKESVWAAIKLLAK